jgi:hypothetical protein
MVAPRTARLPNAAEAFPAAGSIGSLFDILSAFACLTAVSATVQSPSPPGSAAIFVVVGKTFTAKGKDYVPECFSCELGRASVHIKLSDAWDSLPGAADFLAGAGNPRLQSCSDTNLHATALSLRVATQRRLDGGAETSFARLRRKKSTASRLRRLVAFEQHFLE